LYSSCALCCCPLMKKLLALLSADGVSDLKNVTTGLVCRSYNTNLLLKT
jgi:hypothetical protein